MPGFQSIVADMRGTIFLANRITDAHPAHCKVVDRAISIVQNASGSHAELVNVLLILERIIEDGSLELHDSPHQTFFVLVALGLKLDYLQRQEPVPVIRSEEQLIEDTAVVVFTTIHGDNYEYVAGERRPRFNPLVHHVVVHRKQTKATVVEFANPYLAPLLRARPEHHQRIGEYLTARYLDSEREEAVLDLERYLDETDEHPAVRDGWL